MSDTVRLALAWGQVIVIRISTRSTLNWTRTWSVRVSRAKRPSNTSNILERIAGFKVIFIIRQAHLLHLTHCRLLDRIMSRDMWLKHGRSSRVNLLTHFRRQG